jgi:hypothetical protein
MADKQQHAKVVAFGIPFPGHGVPIVWLVGLIPLSLGAFGLYSAVRWLGGYRTHTPHFPFDPFAMLYDSPLVPFLAGPFLTLVGAVLFIVPILAYAENRSRLRLVHSGARMCTITTDIRGRPQMAPVNGANTRRLLHMGMAFVTSTRDARALRAVWAGINSIAGVRSLVEARPEGSSPEEASSLVPIQVHALLLKNHVAGVEELPHVVRVIWHEDTMWDGGSATWNEEE